MCAFRRRARSARVALLRSASPNFALREGNFAFVWDHWCSTSLTSACLWSRSAFSRSKCSSSSSMCSDKFAFSWPSVTHLTRSVSSRASANFSWAPAQASTASEASATHLDCNLETSSARAAARATAPSSFSRNRASTRSCPRTTDSTCWSNSCNRLSAATFFDSIAFMRKATAWRAPSASRFAEALASLSRSSSRFAANLCLASSSSSEERSSVNVSRHALQRSSTASGAFVETARPRASPLVGSFSKQSDKVGPSLPRYACNHSSARREIGAPSSSSSLMAPSACVASASNA
mmetsp:Transcript_17181/g.49025  ORF Transcript_17181/g.49025 Transcript_17181/m.49025 type:complete len:294 (-) Transcript_17181:1248-2129(-)